MENKILAKKSVFPLLIFFFFTAIAVACIAVCAYAFHYMLVVMAVTTIAGASVMLFLHLRAPWVFAELVYGKIILRPSRGKEVVLLPGAIINVSARGNRASGVTKGALTVSTVDEDYDLYIVSNVYDAQRKFLEIMKDEIIKRNDIIDGQDADNVDDSF